MVFCTAKNRPGARGLTSGWFSAQDFSTHSHSCEVPLIYFCVLSGVLLLRVNLSRVLGVSGQDRAVVVQLSMVHFRFLAGVKGIHRIFGKMPDWLKHMPNLYSGKNKLFFFQYEPGTVTSASYSLCLNLYLLPINTSQPASPQQEIHLVIKGILRLDFTSQLHNSQWATRCLRLPTTCRDPPLCCFYLTVNLKSSFSFRPSLVSLIKIKIRISWFANCNKSQGAVVRCDHTHIQISSKYREGNEFLHPNNLSCSQFFSPHR